jgi:hypothetical protein
MLMTALETRGSLKGCHNRYLSFDLRLISMTMSSDPSAMLKFEYILKIEDCSKAFLYDLIQVAERNAAFGAN